MLFYHERPPEYLIVKFIDGPKAGEIEMIYPKPAPILIDPVIEQEKMEEARRASNERTIEYHLVMEEPGQPKTEVDEEGRVLHLFSCHRTQVPE